MWLKSVYDRDRGPRRFQSKTSQFLDSSSIWAVLDSPRGRASSPPAPLAFLGQATNTVSGGFSKKRALGRQDSSPLRECLCWQTLPGRSRSQDAYYSLDEKWMLGRRGCRTWQSSAGMHGCLASEVPPSMRRAWSAERTACAEQELLDRGLRRRRLRGHSQSSANLRSASFELDAKFGENLEEEFISVYGFRERSKHRGEPSPVRDSSSMALALKHEQSGEESEAPVPRPCRRRPLSSGLSVVTPDRLIHRILSPEEQQERMAVLRRIPASSSSAPGPCGAPQGYAGRLSAMGAMGQPRWGFDSEGRQVEEKMLRREYDKARIAAGPRPAGLCRQDSPARRRQGGESSPKRRTPADGLSQDEVDLGSFSRPCEPRPGGVTSAALNSPARRGLQFDDIASPAQCRRGQRIRRSSSGAAGSLSRSPSAKRHLQPPPSTLQLSPSRKASRTSLRAPSPLRSEKWHPHRHPDQQGPLRPPFKVDREYIDPARRPDDVGRTEYFRAFVAVPPPMLSSAHGKLWGVPPEPAAGDARSESRRRQSAPCMRTAAASSMPPSPQSLWRSPISFPKDPQQPDDACSFCSDASSPVPPATFLAPPLSSHQSTGVRLTRGFEHPDRCRPEPLPPGPQFFEATA